MESLFEPLTVDKTDEDRTVFLIPEPNYKRFQKEIAKLSKRSERLIGEPIYTGVVGYQYAGEEPNTYKVLEVYLDAAPPRIDGWEFVARIDHSNETGNVIRKVPNMATVDFSEYYNAAPACQHCNVARKRRDTFVLRNIDTGETQQVGSTCLADFLGHDPSKIARLAEYLGYAVEAARAATEVPGAKELNDYRQIHLEDYLLATAHVVMTQGWVSSGQAYQYGGTATKIHALTTYLQPQVIPYGEDVETLAREALEWAQGMAEDPQSDYENNIAVIANALYIESRSIGLAASIVGVYYTRVYRDRVRNIEVGDMTPLVKLLENAKPKYPKIRMAYDGLPLCISLAGENSRNAGSLYLTDGGPYGNNIYYGRISPEGKFMPSRSVANNEMDTLKGILSELNNDPAGAALRHGKHTGNCCFCNKGLTDTRSVEVGYGKTCASNWGLPW